MDTCMTKAEHDGHAWGRPGDSHLHSAIIAACSDPIYFCTPDFVIREANEAYAQITGVRRKDVIGRTVGDVVGAAVYVDREEHLKRALTGEMGTFQGWISTSYLGQRFYDVKYQPVFDRAGDLLGIATFGRDITDLKEADDALRLYGSIIMQMSDRISVVDRNYRFLHTNESNARWYGCTVEEIVGRPVVDFVGPERLEHEVRPSLEHCFSGQTYEYVLPQTAPDGREVVFSVRAEPFRGADGEVLAAITTMRDVTETYRLSAGLERLALIDDLTGISNRRAFEDWIRERIEAHDMSTGFAVAFLDLDGFKLVNDTIGHGGGDRFLAEIACRLAGFAGKTVHVARIGGDEFGLVVDTDDAVAMRVLCERVLASLNSYHFSWEGMTFRGGVSIGFAMIETNCERGGGLDVSRVLQWADHACMDAKAAGGRQVVEHDGCDTLAAAQRAELRHLAVIGDALERQTFQLERMAIVDIESNAPRFHEVLLRVALPDGSLHGPTMIQATAARHGLLREVDAWAANQVLDRLGAGGDGLPVSLNLSAEVLCHDEFARALQTRLEATPDLALLLMLEISETQVARLDAAAWILLKRLRRLGVRVALDNFGGGFGAITQIRDGMFDMVKIDRMLVADLADEPVKRAAVIGAVALANALGLPTVAEYVDGPALVPVLRDLGVRFVQGHGIARPVPWPAIG